MENAPLRGALRIRSTRSAPERPTERSARSAPERPGFARSAPEPLRGSGWLRMTQISLVRHGAIRSAYDTVILVAPRIL